MDWKTKMSEWVSVKMCDAWYELFTSTSNTSPHTHTHSTRKGRHHTSNILIMTSLTGVHKRWQQLPHIWTWKLHVSVGERQKEEKMKLTFGEKNRLFLFISYFFGMLFWQRTVVWHLKKIKHFVIKMHKKQPENKNRDDLRNRGVLNWYWHWYDQTKIKYLIVSVCIKDLCHHAVGPG